MKLHSLKDLYLIRSNTFVCLAFTEISLEHSVLGFTKTDRLENATIFTSYDKALHVIEALRNHKDKDRVEDFYVCSLQATIKSYAASYLKSQRKD